jgi:fucose permease
VIGAGCLKRRIDTNVVRIFLIFFVNSLQEQISGNLLPYVTSAFQEHSLTATTIVLYTLIAGVIKLPIAKVMDVWGRPQGFVFMLFCAVIGKPNSLMFDPAV